MKRHKHLISLVMTAALTQLAACGSDPQQPTQLAGVRDNASILLVENSFLDGSTLHYLLMNDSLTKEPRAYAIDCRGKNIAELAAAFGVDSATPYQSSESHEMLELNYKISQQPVLRCSHIHPSSSNASIQKVFQLIDDRTPDKKKEKPLPQLFVRFQNVTADDSTNQEQFYSLGCRNILNTFGTVGQKSLAEVIPIMASSASIIFPDFEKYRPLNCMTNTLDPLLNKFPKVMEDLPLRVTQGSTVANLEFHRVVDSLNPQRTLSYLMGRGTAYNRILCPNVPDAEIKAALNFPSSYATREMRSDDPRYINARLEPELECVNIFNQNSFESRWVSMRSLPLANSYKKKDVRTLYRFGCPSAEKYFTAGLNLPANPLLVTTELLDYLATTPTTGHKLVTFPCHAASLTRDPTALQMGEVISLGRLSPGASTQWLDGNTTSSAVLEVAQQNTGSYWLVQPAGGDGSFHLRALGHDPQLNYLACPVQGNSPKMVKTPDESGYQTKWMAYRGDGASHLRLGCTGADGRIRFLYGLGSYPLLSDETTATDPKTNWWVQHQSFVEDSSLFIPGNIVSLYSLLTPQNERWLSAYPADSVNDTGLEANNSSFATQFEVERRKDGRGISLKSINSGQGDRYLDCKVAERWLELAPVTDGIYTGTGFKVYRLSNSPFPIFKIACFDGSGRTPHWLSFSGKAPWLHVGMPANLSDGNSILFLQIRPNPTRPGAEPRREKMPGLDFTFENRCDFDFEASIFSFDTAWTTRTATIRSKSTYLFPVQNRYTYYVTSPGFGGGGEASRVFINFQGSWRESIEFDNRQPGGTNSWYNMLIFC